MTIQYGVAEMSKTAGASDALKRLYSKLRRTAKPVSVSSNAATRYDELVKTIENSGEAHVAPAELDKAQRAAQGATSGYKIPLGTLALGFPGGRAENGFQYVPDTVISADKSTAAGRVVNDAKRIASNAAFGLKDIVLRALYRLGAYPDDQYARHMDDVRVHALENNRLGIDPASVEENIRAGIGGRLYGKGSSRGDVYENRASRKGVLSSSFIGRAIGAHQPSPEELGVRSDADKSSWDGGSVITGEKFPGAATALDLGGYLVPWLGEAMYARDISEKVSDGKYGQATAMAFAPAIASKTYNIAGRPLMRASARIKDPVARAIGVTGATTGAVASGFGMAALPDYLGRVFDNFVGGKHE